MGYGETEGNVQLTYLSIFTLSSSLRGYSCSSRWNQSGPPGEFKSLREHGRWSHSCLAPGSLELGPYLTLPGLHLCPDNLPSFLVPPRSRICPALSNLPFKSKLGAFGDLRQTHKFMERLLTGAPCWLRHPSTHPCCVVSTFAICSDLVFPAPDNP